MSRISNNSFAVNSSLEQIVEISGGSITPSGTQNVDVVANTIGLSTSANQTTANTSLANIDSNTSGLATEATLTIQSSTITNIDGKITQGYDAQVASGGNGLQQTLCYGLDTGGNLDALRVDNSGHLEVTIDDFVKGQTTSANSFPVVLASDQSSVPVTFSSGTHSGSQANLFSASSVVAGDTSSVITTTSSSKINIFGNTTDTANSIEVEMSADNINWYPVGFGIFPDSSGNFAEFLNRPSNYWRIKVGGTATITATLLHS
jgi:hypothetical protein